MAYPNEALVVRPGTAEYVALPTGGFHLLADAVHTGGVLGANRLTLGAGADGARPHHHALSAELFYVVEGVAEFLLDRTMVRVEAGGVVLVPPNLVHAFGAAPGTGVDLFIVLTPGVDRFEYFRALGRIQGGDEPFASLLPMQDHYDVHFQDPAAWLSRRTAGQP
ncbi:cupin domain-containing protein [Micromonospora sp. URMC 106]|jgi:quercetin dioxygenase-like cupin family protein|uniref:cupin domain-containing protein n=1 Tax=Micromonospora sp. URMC 106 TaxID=3423408 RepID=UPI003F1D1781